MLPYETETASAVQAIHRRNHLRYRYQKVLDSRKQPIRSLWKPNRWLERSDYVEVLRYRFLVEYELDTIAPRELKQETLSVTLCQ